MKKIATDVSAQESQRIIQQHKDDHVLLKERLEFGGKPTGRFDVYIDENADTNPTVESY